MEMVKIKRTGAPDLIFNGEEIASVSGRYLNGRELSRWTDLKLYLTEERKLGIELIFVTPVEGEFNYSRAKICDSPQEVFDWLFGSNGALKPRSPEAAREIVGKLRFTSNEWAFVHMCANLHNLTWSAYARCVLVGYKLPPLRNVREALDAIIELGNRLNEQFKQQQSYYQQGFIHTRAFEQLIPWAKEQFTLLRKLKTLLERGEDNG
jgi:hypothetical protein